MVAIQEKIHNFTQEAEDVSKIIVRGSDEHLDILSQVRSIVDETTKKLVDLNEELIGGFNKLAKKDIVLCVNELKRLSSTLNKLRATLRKSSIYRDIPTCYAAYVSGIEQLREITYDLENFRLKDDEGLDSLLNQLNEL